MQCPIDGETLLMTARNGVEIDYCPRCRGIWLDRGELDKIIERTEGIGNPSAPASSIQPAARKRDDDDDNDKKTRDDRKRREKNRDDDRPQYYKKSNKHASFIKELFDF